MRTIHLPNAWLGCSVSRSADIENEPDYGSACLATAASFYKLSSTTGSATYRNQGSRIGGVFFMQAENIYEARLKNYDS